MSKLQDFRRSYPQYDDLSDEQLLGGLHRRFYSDMPLEVFTQRMTASPLPTAPAVRPGSGSSFLRGIDELQGDLYSAVEGIGSLTGIGALRRFGQEGRARNEQEAEQSLPESERMSFAQAEGVRQNIRAAGQALGSSAPSMAPGLAGAVGGAAIGSVVPGLGTGLGAIIGGTAASLPQFFGANRRRQIQESGEVQSELAALGTAIPQAASEAVVDRLTLGLGRILGIGGESVARDLLPRIARGIGVGAAANVPAEVIQQALERAQAGLDVLGPDAMAEYQEAATAAAVVGGGLGGTVAGVFGGAPARPADVGERADLRGAIEDIVAGREPAEGEARFPGAMPLLPRERRDIETEIGDLTYTQLRSYMDRRLPELIETNPELASRLEYAQNEAERVEVFRDFINQEQADRRAGFAAARQQADEAAEPGTRFPIPPVREPTPTRPPSAQFELPIQPAAAGAAPVAPVEAAPAAPVVQPAPVRAEETAAPEQPTARPDWRAGEPADTVPEPTSVLPPSIKELLDYMRKGRAAPKGQTSLVQAIIKAGGLKDTGGEVKQALGGTAKTRPGLLNRKGGLQLDEAAEYLAGRGYFVDMPTDNDILEAINDELSKRSVNYGKTADTRGQELEAAARDLDREMSTAGLSVNDPDDVIARGLGFEPTTEPRTLEDIEREDAARRIEFSARRAAEAKKAEEAEPEAEEKAPNEDKGRQIVNKYLAELRAMGRQGRLIANSLDGLLKDRTMNANQIYQGFIVGETLAKTLPSKADYRIQFLQKLTVDNEQAGAASGAKLGDPAQGRVILPTPSLPGFIQLSLDEKMLPLLRETAAHEAFHVLQSYFSAYDPTFADRINKFFKPDMKITDLEPSIKRRLMAMKVPGEKISYYDALVEGLGDAPLSVKEAQAYAFGSLIDAANRGQKVTALIPSFQRFVTFARAFFGSMKRALLGDGFKSPADILTQAQQRGVAMEQAAPQVQGSEQYAARITPEQKISSADTSIRQVAATFRRVPFEPGTVNLDYGGGRFDLGTDFMREKGVENLVYDPFNRSKDHNDAVMRRMDERKADTVTVNNVLNVIQEPESRDFVVQDAARHMKPDGTAYFLVYEGDRSGDGKQTSKGFQNNAKTETYLPEVRKHFDDVARSGNIIVARKPKQAEAFSARRVPAEYSARSSGSSFADATYLGFSKELMGPVIYQDRDVALIEAISGNGDPLYIGVSSLRGKRTLRDIESYVGDIFSKEELNRLLKARDERVAERERLSKQNPKGPFENSNTAFDKDFPEDLRGFADGIVKELGLSGEKIMFFTFDGAKAPDFADRNKLYGNYFSIKDMAFLPKKIPGVYGVARNRIDGQYRAVAINSSKRKSVQMETLAHEIGHIFDSVALQKASPETIREIEDSFREWLGKAEKKPAREYVKLLRTPVAGKLQGAHLPEKGLTGRGLNQYSRSFSEWFADQVARWSLTSEPAKTLIGKFFQRIAAAYQALVNRLGATARPDATVAKFIEQRRAATTIIPPEPKPSFRLDKLRQGAFGFAGTGKPEQATFDFSVNPNFEEVTEAPRTQYSARKVPAEYAARATGKVAGLPQYGQRVPASTPATVNGAELNVQYDVASRYLGKKFGRFIAPAKIERFFSKMQDSMLPVGRMIDDIKAAGGNVPVAMDAYLKEDLLQGKVADMLEKRGKSLYTPLIEAVSKSGISMQDFENYLYARHAPERNKYIASINPKMPDGGSGLSNADAKAMMDEFQRDGKTPKLKNLAAMFDKIIADTNKLRVESGLTPDFSVIKTTEDGRPLPNYQDYAPLRGFADESIDADEGTREVRPKTGKMLGARGREDKRATGRERMAGDILAHAIMQNTQAVIRSEQNKVGQAFLEMVRSNPGQAQDLAEIVKSAPLKTTVVDGVVKTVPDMFYKNNPDILVVKEGGKEVAIRIKDEAVARAMTGSSALSPTSKNLLVQSMASLNRFLAKINTAYNPEFLITNFARDLQTFGVNVQQYDLDGIARDSMRDLKGALSGVRDSVRGTDNNPAMRKAFERFKELGGTTEMYGFGDLETRIGEINDIMAKAGTQAKSWKDMAKTVMPVIKFIEDYNTIVENGIRTSLFKNLVDRGINEERAAQLAKNVTVNFTKGGENRVLMNALYLFYNASLQGTMAMVNAIGRSPKVRKIVAGVVVAGVLQDVLNSMLSDVDDDEKKQYDKIPDHILKRSFVLMDPFQISERGYFSFPMPYGFNAFFNMGREMSKAARGESSPMKAAGNIAGTFIDSFNPIGGSESFYNFMAPTIIDPLVDIGMNRDFTGRPIVPERGSFGVQLPESQKYWNNTFAPYVSISNFLNSLTGGTPVIPGAVDISPNMIQYVVNYATGGVGKFVERTYNTATSTIPGALRGDLEELDVRGVPFLRSLYGSVTTRDDMAVYVDRMEEVLRVRKEINDAAQSGQPERISAALERYPGQVQIMDAFSRLSRDRAQIGQRINEISRNQNIPDESKKEIIKSLREQQNSLVRLANRLYVQNVENR